MAIQLHTERNQSILQEIYTKFWLQVLMAIRPCETEGVLRMIRMPPMQHIIHVIHALATCVVTFLGQMLEDAHII